ncbi:MerR family transcriptional regulator [Umezawaea sp. NPDC059074]|uniref:helix-turn-helix domain-containing protein n=1 Tax=Umezawaea sp. NPDC059074 TaxID=3346716 RepID=UPI003679ECAB
MDDGAELFTIGQLARLTGLRARTIRFWSDNGAVPPTTRSAGGYRLYDAAAVARLDLVRTLRDLGLGLDEVHRVLDRQVDLADVAAVHVRALDAEMRALRLRRAVLNAVAQRRGTPEGMALMHRLATLSARERQRIIDDFIGGVFADVRSEDAAIVAEWMRELPDDPSPEQVDAWVELAELVADEDFGRKLRHVVLHGGGSERLEFGLAIRPVVLEHAGGAVEEGIAADSALGRVVLDRIVPPDEPSSDLVAWLEVVVDARIERYWQLLSLVNGRVPGPPTVPAFQWLLAALRAHRAG